MKFKGFFILSLVLAAAIIILDFFAFKYYWYWQWYWFDKSMHFLGGFLVATVFLQLYFWWFRRSLNGWWLIGLSIFPALVVGGLWEFFEFTTERFYLSAVVLKSVGMLYGGWEDSIRDLFFDLLGSLSAVSLFMVNLIWTKRKLV